MKVRDLTRPAHYLPLDATVVEAAKLLLQCKVSAFLVGEKGDACGILTERDLLRFVAKCEDVSRTKLGTIMHTPVISIGEDQGVIEAGKLMEQHDIRHLGVKDKAGKFVGLITAKMISRNQVRLWYGRALFD